MSYSKFAYAFKVRTRSYGRPNEAYRDETLQQQKTRRAKDSQQQQKIHDAWLKDETR